jgi:hypothetical protein
MENWHGAEPLFDLDNDVVASFPSDETLPSGDLQDESAGSFVGAGLPADLELDAVYGYFGQRSDAFGPAIRQALDEVIASGRTRRWNLDQCNNQEKAYVGVNIENVLRQQFDWAEGLHGMDFDIEGVDVDCKWSRTFGGWQIPKEAVGHICLLIYGDDLDNKMAVGVIRITEDILVGGNRDLKRTIQRPEGLARAQWIISAGQGTLPENFLMSISKTDRDAILAPRGGNARAIELFKRCEGIVIHRRVIEAIGQQIDEARRFRGEARAELARQGYEVLNGHWKENRARAAELGGPEIVDSTQWLALRTDGSTPERRAKLDPIRRREAEAFRREMMEGFREIRRRRAADRRAAKAAELTLAEASAEAEIVERQVRAAVISAENLAAAHAKQDAKEQYI